MTISLTDYFNANKEFGPIDSADSSLLLDLDFTLGETAIDAILVTTHGFTKSGSGGTWDTNGFDPNGTRYYNNTNWTVAGTTRATAFANKKFTIYAEIERAALTSTWLDDASNFIQEGTGPSSSVWDGATVTAANHPYGDYTGGPKQGFAFYVGGTNANHRLNCGYQVDNAAGNPIGRAVMEMHDGTTASHWTARLSSDVISHADIDSTFAKVMITGDGLEIRWYVDKGLVRRRAYPTDWTSTGLDIFKYASIGTASNNPSGYIFRGYIRRYQIANRCLKGAYTHLGTRVGFFGDSITASGSHQTAPTLTVAGVNAVNSSTAELYGTKMALVDTSLNNPSVGTYQNPWHRGLMRVSALDGLPFRYYVAGDSGHGWSNTVGDTTVQIRQAFFDAMIAYDPEILVCLGSPNDIDYANPPTDLLAETKAALDQFIDGCPSLRKILFYQTLPPYKGDYVGDTSYKALYLSQIEIQKGLQDYRGIVQFVPTYDALGGDNHSVEFCAGGSQYAPLWDALYTGSVTENNLHPYQYGQNRMVEIMWPALKKVLLRLPVLSLVASLLIVGAGNYVTLGNVHVSIGYLV